MCAGLCVCVRLPLHQRAQLAEGASGGTVCCACPLPTPPPFSNPPRPLTGPPPPALPLRRCGVLLSTGHCRRSRGRCSLRRRRRAVTWTSCRCERAGGGELEGGRGSGHSGRKQVPAAGAPPVPYYSLPLLPLPPLSASLMRRWTDAPRASSSRPCVTPTSRLRGLATG